MFLEVCREDRGGRVWGGRNDDGKRWKRSEVGHGRPD